MISSVEARWAVEFAGFAKTYRPSWAGGGIDAVCGVTLQLAPGQVLGLLGPNGSGKSTMLKALAGLVAPTSGTCRVFGHPAGSNAARALVGYLPESPRFPRHLTGRKFLEYCAGLSLLEPAVAADRLEAVLRWSGLGAAARLPMETYSKGMNQRLGLAQAVLHDPPLVLLDEPAGGLAPEGRLALSGLVRELAARGRTVVFSSHLLTQAADLCDRLVILGEGRLLAEGTPAGLLGAGHAACTDPSPLEKLYLEKLGRHE